MNSRYLQLYLVLLLLSFNSIAQQPAFNQNSSRSNHTRAYNQNSARSNNAKMLSNSNDWQFGINTGASVGMKSNEASMFRGNGFVTGLNGQYFFGQLGLGVSGGLINSKLNTSAINQFIIDRKFPQTSTVTTSPAQNAFLMLGPSFRLGNKAQLIASAKGGVFFNQSGGLTIGQQGAVRPFYRFDGGSKSVFPGFNGSLSFSYPLNNTSALVLSTDYMRSSSSVQLFDPQQGIDIPVEQKRNFQTVNAGISFIKTFNVKSPRDPASGQATGKRSAETNDNDNQTTNRVLKTRTKSNQTNERTTNTDEDVSIIDPENKRVLKTKTKSNQSNDRTTNESCGPVTLKTTKPDGTIEEQIFSCPDDALQYQRKGDGMPNRISMNVTVPKQTQGATFGEKVNQGMQSAGSHIIAGRIVHKTNETGIITNQNRIGGAAAASYASTGLAVSPGAQTNLYVREAGSGQATGKQTREAASGMATGRSQYQPLFVEGLPQGDVCNPCMGVVNNPIYEEKGNKGNNPLSEKSRIIGKEQCDDRNAKFDVHLVDRTTGAVVATTQTNSCGEYWFANVPDGNYAVAVIGMWLSKKGYDYYQAQSNLRTDVAGEATVPDETWQHIIYGAGRGKVSVQDISVVVSDTDGDGLAEFFRAQGTFTDGTTQDFTQSSAAKGGGTGKVSMQDFHFTIPVSNQRGGKVSMQDIHFTKRSGTNTYRVIATFSDGTSQDISELVDIKQSGSVLQCSVQLGDVDGDGMADLIWSPRSNIGVSSESAKVNVQDLSFTKKTDHHVQHMAVHIGDVDGDGMTEIIIGNNEDDDHSMSRPGNPISGLTIKGGKNPGGDTARHRMNPGENDPNEEDFPLAIPGNPIGGISIKGGKNPGGLIQQRTTNSLGEFEFPNLEAGNYRFTVETRYVINNVTDIDLDGEGTGIYAKGGYVKITASQNGQSLRTNTTTGGTQPNTKAQDHNSSRSNKTASGISTDNNSNDSTGNNQNKAQNNNTVRSNRISNALVATDDLLQTLTEIEGMLDAETNQTRTGINTSRSNIKNMRTRINELENHLQKNEIAAAKMVWAEINKMLADLDLSLTQMGGNFTSVSNVLKTKHDTAKNSIRNIR